MDVSTLSPARSMAGPSSLADLAKAHLLPALTQSADPRAVQAAIAQIYTRFHMPPAGGVPDPHAVEAMGLAARDPDDHGAFVQAASALSAHDRRALAQRLLQEARGHPDPIMVYDRLTSPQFHDKMQALGVEMGPPTSPRSADAGLTDKAKAMAKKKSAA